ncbi:MAG TPA: hypothetical protein VJ438_00530 [Candidatus Nanoarchaeia archaeon]|nr:hypothetical protein [Candidatus Nanoarchaeia archaeon]
MDTEKRSLRKTLSTILLPGSLLLPAIDDLSCYNPHSNQGIWNDYYSPFIHATLAVKTMFIGGLELARIGVYATAIGFILQSLN